MCGALENCCLTMPPSGDCLIRTSAWSLAGNAETWQVYTMAGTDAQTICQVDARGRDGDTWSLDVRLPQLRIEHLAKGILFALFQGRIDALDLHLKPEAVHFGVGEPDLRYPHHFKDLRHADGRQNPEKVITSGPWRNTYGDDRTDGVLDILTHATSKLSSRAMPGLLQTTGQIRPAEFALQMVEGVDRVQFLRFGADKEDE